MIKKYYNGFSCLEIFLADIVNGYLVKITPYKEDDGLALILTQNNGLITCYLKNYKQSKKRFQGTLDKYMLNEFDVSFKDNSDFCFLNSAKIINPHLKLRDNVQKLLLCEFIMEVLLNISNEPSESDFIFFNKNLLFLEEVEEVDMNLFLYFQFALLNSAGMLPYPICNKCGCDLTNEHRIYFSEERNLFLCKAHKTENALPIEVKIINFIAEIYNKKYSEVENLTKSDKAVLQKIFYAYYYKISTRKLASIDLLKEFL